MEGACGLADHGRQFDNANHAQLRFMGRVGLEAHYSNRMVSDPYRRTAICMRS
jgi:hypothetical protein